MVKCRSNRSRDGICSGLERMPTVPPKAGQGIVSMRTFRVRCTHVLEVNCKQ